MCGIVGYVGHRECTDVLINGLSKLEYRGYDSAGIAVFDHNHKICVAKSKGRLQNLIDRMNQDGKPSGCAGIGSRVGSPVCSSVSARAGASGWAGAGISCSGCSVSGSSVISPVGSDRKGVV